MQPYQQCPMCASREQEALPRASSLTSTLVPLVRCRICRFIYRPTPQREDGNRRPGVAEMERWLSMVEGAVARGMLLDIGCGDGHFLSLAEQHGWLAAGVESARVEPKVEHNRIWPRVRTALCEGLWPASSFDAVTLWQPLAHCADPLGLLQLIAHYCRTDGVLTCQFAAQELPPGQSTGPTGDSGGSLPPFSIGALHRMLTRFGFHIERVEQGRRQHPSDCQRLAPAIYPPLPCRQHHPTGAYSPAQRRTVAPAQEPLILVIARHRS